MRDKYEKETYWNRCDICGRFIRLKDLKSGRAMRKMITPDSDRSNEEYETLCYKDKKYKDKKYETQ